MHWRNGENVYHFTPLSTSPTSDGGSSIELTTSSDSSRRSSIASAFRRRSSVASVTSSIKSWWRPVSYSGNNLNGTPYHMHASNFPQPQIQGTITFNTRSFGGAASPPASEKKYFHVPQHAAADHARQMRVPSLSIATKASSLEEATRRSSLVSPTTMPTTHGLGLQSECSAVRARSFSPRAARAPSIESVDEVSSLQEAS